MTDWVRIEDVDVDAGALLRIAHACDPMICRHTKCCCRSYEVPIERNETERLVGCAPDAAGLAPALTENGDLIDPVEESGKGLCLNTDEQGRCVFAYASPKGAVRCALHSLALEWNLPPASIKPRACSLWPLAIHGRRPMQLSIQEDAFTFPCNTRRRAGGRKLHPGVTEIIEATFGPEFLGKLQLALRERAG